MSAKIIEHNGVKLSINEWAKRVGLNDSTIRSRLVNGWTVGQALGSKASSVYVCRHKTPGRSASRNDAEMWLNDAGGFSIPGKIYRLLPNGADTKRPGTWIRANHPSVFEEFYLKDFILRHHD